MSIFNIAKKDKYYNNPEDDEEVYDEIDADDDDDDDEGIGRFATGVEETFQSKTQRSSRRSSRMGMNTSDSSDYHSASDAVSFRPSASAYQPSGSALNSPTASYKPSDNGSGSYFSGTSSYPAPNLRKVNTPGSRRKVEELYMADLKETSDALAVADLVKEKRYALIINLNPLKSESSIEFSAVVNFIDGVCYVTDTEFKEINQGSGLFLIYHKDIILNEGFGGYSSATNY